MRTNPEKQFPSNRSRSHMRSNRKSNLLATMLPAILISVICVGCGLADAKESRLDQALETIRNAERVETHAVGAGGITPEIYDTCMRVAKLATRDQLLAYARDKSPTLRAYAAMALGKRFPKEDFFDLLMEKLKDVEEVQYLDGCGQYPMKIGDIYFDFLSENLSDTHRDKVIDYLLSNGFDLFARHRMLRDWKIPESFLPKLRLWAPDDGSALLALAKFKQDRDKPVIIAAVKTNPLECFQCIAMNPQPEFFKVLQDEVPNQFAEKFSSWATEEFHRAVAAFKTAESAALFARFLDGKEQEVVQRDRHLELIYKSITPTSDPVYDSLKWRFWGEHNRINLTDFKRLLVLDKARATVLTRNTLDHLTLDISFELLWEMVTLMISEDPAHAESVIANELAKCVLSQYDIFAQSAACTRRDAYIEPLFKAVESSGDPRIFLAAAEALVSYQRESINQRLRLAPQTNKELAEGWGGKQFGKLLETTNPPQAKPKHKAR